MAKKAKTTRKTSKKKGAGLRVFAVISAVLVVSAGVMGAFQHFTPYKIVTPKEQEQEQPLPTQPDVTDENGNELASGTVYAMPASLAYAVPTSESAQASEGVTIQATVLPEYATNKALTWSLAFANPSSAWANGKNVNDYVKVEVNGGDSTIVTVSCLAPFGERIILTAQSVSNPEVTASCNVEFMQKVESATVTCGEFVIELAPTSVKYNHPNTINPENLPVTNFKVALDNESRADSQYGGQIRQSVQCSEVYTMAFNITEWEVKLNDTISPSAYTMDDDSFTKKAGFGTLEAGTNIARQGSLFMNKYFLYDAYFYDSYSDGNLTNKEYMGDMNISTVQEYYNKLSEEGAARVGSTYNNIIYCVSLYVKTESGQEFYYGGNLRWDGFQASVSSISTSDVIF